ncbi:50S ribosomal protein L29 [Algiphilus sp.]|uniref:50S ribosomal protein L29 n=1 Tax=Algiphilus sp. TaxID=1872431 RepID=UPI0025BC6281|nr:50S ribosomal protein L29 [Algiphilus sp.]MCK5770472.1 50S ribosomal protein L29 [Algiphilus sp.]
MKSTDYLKSLSGKDDGALREELESLRKEQFNLRMQAATGQLTQHHRAREVRRNIARVKTMMRAAKG